jgi:hypothetical protein
LATFHHLAIWSNYFIDFILVVYIKLTTAVILSLLIDAMGISNVAHRDKNIEGKCFSLTLSKINSFEVKLKFFIIASSFL